MVPGAWFSLAMDAQEARGGEAEGTWWRGAQPLRLTTSCYPVLVRAIPSLLALFALDGTKADVSSPNGYHWVPGREDASTRTSKTVGVLVFLWQIHSGMGGAGLLCAHT